MLYILLFFVLISLFILGMKILRAGLFALSGESLKNWLAKLTSSPVKGLLAGTVVTALLHSSSAVMVITIGFISAGMLTFPRSIGIILGTNVGTTFTTEFITFDLDMILVPMAVLGACFMLFDHKKIKSSGYILFGMSAVFIAIMGFEFLTTPLTALPIVEDVLLLLNESHIISILFGMIFTALIQSSTAMTGIAMGFLSGGILQIDTGIAIMLGSNIGTCITAFLASVGSGRESKLCAYSHIWLNVVGVALFFPFIDLLASLAPTIAEKPDVQLAHASLIFNLSSSLVMLPFAEQFGKFILLIHGRKGDA
jgi:phosphate:Na+ symporter